MSTWTCSDCGGHGWHFNMCPAWLRQVPDPRDAEITALRAEVERLERQFDDALSQAMFSYRYAEKLRARMEALVKFIEVSEPLFWGYEELQQQRDALLAACEREEK